MNKFNYKMTIKEAIILVMILRNSNPVLTSFEEKIFWFENTPKLILRLQNYSAKKISFTDIELALFRMSFRVYKNEMLPFQIAVDDYLYKKYNINRQ